MKNISLTFTLVMMVLAAVAQPETMSGFVAGAITQNNTYSVLGQPFVGTSEGSGYQVVEGIAQAQLVRQKINAVVNVGEAYADNGFSYPATTPAGIYHNSGYVVHGAEYYYDLLKLLTLKVEGPFSCGDPIMDVDFNEYPTVYVAGRCWTQKNLMAEHYPDGVTAIPNARVYQDDAANLPVYGRLYTWCAAVGVSGDCSAAPAVDADGYVQGVCPDGWHIPTTAEMEALRTVSVPALNSTTLWVGPTAAYNTNASGFTALPAGKYNATLLRYEGLGTEADWWSDSGAYDPSTHTTTANVYICAWYCDGVLTETRLANDAVSVRCVKNS
ncbi:MAG: fibrobacter succinogenes major paralogous domain-containing protein [Bacteroidales bacterium]|nr:fibrobacter succinogenes major paralogous domain-containing protein [Bacteroidales bacterium]